MTTRTLATALALILAAPAAQAATASQPDAKPSIALMGVRAHSALAGEIESRATINRVLKTMRTYRPSSIDQQADQDIRDDLKTAITNLPAGKDFLTKRDHAALVSFYEARDFRPAWYEDGMMSKSARKLVFALSRADVDGLAPADYTTPALSIGRKSGSASSEIAKADVALSLAITRYTREAYAGRVDPRMFSKKEMTIKPHYPDSIKALASILRADDPVAEMRSFNPHHKGFLALRDEYNRLRFEGRQETLPDVPSGKSMKLGMRDERVPLLRRKLGISVPEENANVYSSEVEEAVVQYQTDNGLIADGIVGNATLAILNENREELLADIVANMERWRWLPRDLGEFHILVNIPTFHVEVVKDDKIIHQTRVVVGKSHHKTPLFSDQMEYLVVNPYWNVPRSIASKELIPKIRNNPAAFFSNANYQVLASVKGRTQVIDPNMLDWDKVKADQVRLRQTPGTRNALGNIKFMFPNSHAVYLHDTPSRSLFNRDYRAFSHGCVRVQNPMDFAEVVLSQTTDWNASRVRKMIGGNERRVNLDHKIPVHIAYFTTWMSESGTLQLRTDIYGHNAKVKKALGL